MRSTTVAGHCTSGRGWAARPRFDRNRSRATVAFTAQECLEVLEKSGALGMAQGMDQALSRFDCFAGAEGVCCPGIAIVPTADRSPMTGSKCFPSSTQARQEWRSCKPGPRAPAPPTACKGSDGRHFARGLARPAAGARQRCLRGSLRAIVQASFGVPPHRYLFARRRAGDGARRRTRRDGRMPLASTHVMGWADDED